MKLSKVIVPLAALIAAILWLAASLRPEKNATTFDVAGFARLHVKADGRSKPLDTVARATLLRFQGRQAVRNADGRKLEPAEWLLDATFRPEAAARYRVFEITHPELLALAHLRAADGDGGKRFSFAQLQNSIDAIHEKARQADARPSAGRDGFDRAVLALYGNLAAYRNLEYSLAPPAGAPAHDTFHMMAQFGTLLAIPSDAPGGEWRKPGEAFLADAAAQNKTGNPAALAYAGLAYTWRAQDAASFNEIIRLFHADLAKRFPAEMRKASIETAFNRADLFYHSSILFVIVFLCAAVSWLRWPDALRWTALHLMTLAWLVTTAGILTRMCLGGYPPVTNLYSSALGVAWFAVTLCLVLEILFRNAIGSMAGGIIGFCALLIAHYLSLSGDTLEMMQAVLDNNFWLATHVVTITFGYGAMFLAGILGVIYIVLHAFTGALTRETSATITRMVYGIVCFAMLFSFAGTVLGGIWADQSWGRFWGWDPKENGALIIVIWCAVLLHARWGGLVRERGIMAMAVFGNVVTAWSWFGTNLLEVGLHSYGFTSSGAIALAAFVASQLIVIGLALLPPKNV